VSREFKAYLAAKLLIDSPWTETAIGELLNSCRSPKAQDLGPLAAILIARYPTPISFNRLVTFLSRGTKPQAATLLSLRKLDFAVSKMFIRPRKMRAQVTAAQSWPIPRIDSVSELSELLDVSCQHIDWLSANYASHYTIKAIRKRSGGIRIIESPKPFLKKAQQVVLKLILDAIPTHPSVHGFVKGRSAISFVEPHINKPFLLRMDLQDCFPSVHANRVWGLFRSLGYSVDVTQLLTAICTCYSTPSQLLEAMNGGMKPTEQNRILSLHHRKHLPQGAPASPALLNLIAYRLDCRLAGLAEACNATYTRYADDLLFSGDEKFARTSESFTTSVGAIVLEEGFQLHYRKTRRMRKSTRQLAAGIVINRTTNMRRSEFDALKATLTNCVRSGPQTQNRDNVPSFRSHLLGRILWVKQLNPNRGEKLMQIYDRIDWGA
jgi:RNA-directed DNA polymerase